MNLAATLFLLVDGHHMLIRVLAGSFETFPLGGSFAFATLAEPLFASAGEMFESGARIAAPVTGLLLLVNASIGLLNRVMPHLSIFNVGFPLTVMAGMLAVLASLPRAANFFLSAYQILEHNLADLFLG
jgi:flagellar biosynthetic protein FliR